MQIQRFGGKGVRGKPTYTYSSSLAVNVSFCSAPPFTCLLEWNLCGSCWCRALVTFCLLLNVHQWSNKNLVLMCAKVISISYTCWATYNNQKTTLGQEVHKFYPFQPLFLAYWGVSKIRTKVANFAPRLGGTTAECSQLPGDFAPDQGLCLWTPLRARHESYWRILSTPVFSTWRRPWLRKSALKTAIILATRKQKFKLRNSARPSQQQLSSCKLSAISRSTPNNKWPQCQQYSDIKWSFNLLGRPNSKKL